MAWIESVFYHNTPGPYIHRHCMETKALPAAMDEWRAEAFKTLAKTGADHVVYCTVEYNAEDVPVEVNFYMEPFGDDEFFGRTDAVVRDAGKKGRTMYVGAVHKHK